MSAKRFEVPGLDLAGKLFQRGTDCLGPDEVENAFGASLAPAPEDVPPITLSEAMLNHLRKLGMCIELHGPTTMVELYDALGNKLGDENGKLLYKVDWYAEDPFYTEERASGWHWRVVTKALIPNSTSKKYLPQTLVLSEYLRDQVFAGQPLPNKFQLAIEELNDREKELAELVERDWKAGAEQVVNLAVNQLCRGTAAQSLWGIAFYKKVNNEYLLPNVWEWLKSRSSVGCLVCVGDADAGGVRVVGGHPRDSDDDLGVRFSCSAEDLVS